MYITTKDIALYRRRVADVEEGYVRVIASAGNGKTRALTHRYVFLVNDVGIATATTGVPVTVIDYR